MGKLKINKDLIVNKLADKNIQVKKQKPAKGAPMQSYGTGGRKNAIARVWLRVGNGEFIVNNKSLDQYFTRDFHKIAARKPLVVNDILDGYDVHCTVKGGGLSGQSGAISHGLALALRKLSDDFRPILRKEGLLTRNSKVVERKKPGQPKARKKTQFSKR